MPSPFPGIDPFLESQGLWPDFHAGFVPAFRDAIAAQLPASYVARIDERMNLVELEAEEMKQFRPDVAITRQGPEHASGSTQGIALLLEPVVVSFKVMDEFREIYLEILHGPNRKLVTVIELLSPSNKTGSGYRDFLAKHNAWMRRDINLVELDFLSAGRRLPIKQPFPPGDYYAYVSRADLMPECALYAWTIRAALPSIPIPLLGPDPDLVIPLAPIFAGVYERARYERSIDYHAPLTLPLKPDDCAWAEQLGRSATL